MTSPTIASDPERVGSSDRTSSVQWAEGGQSANLWRLSHASREQDESRLSRCPWRSAKEADRLAVPTSPRILVWRPSSHVL